MSGERESAIEGHTHKADIRDERERNVRERKRRLKTSLSRVLRKVMRREDNSMGKFVVLKAISHHLSHKSEENVSQLGN